MSVRAIHLLTAAVMLVAPAAFAYPGGTPDFQTDIVTACAGCHSSLNEEVLAGAGARAAKEVAEAKHLTTVLAGEKAYAELSEADRAVLADHIRAVDANASIEIEYPPQVAAGESFQVTVRLVGGAGPVVGIALVDRPHRWYAKAASSVGWQVVGAPSVIGPDGKPQSDWLNKRPERLGRGLTYLNITGVESDAAAGTWSKSKAVFTLKAPTKPGDYPLVGAFFYGTEKASPLGFNVHPIYGKQTRGGFLGHSGRVKFTDVKLITVK